MRGPTDSYKGISKSNAAQVDGKFGVSFGDFARLSGFSLNYAGDGNSTYEFSSTGHLKRGRRNSASDRSDEEVARAACNLLHDPKFVKQMMKGFGEKKYAITEKDVRNFTDNIERHYHVSEKDHLTSKLMS